MGNFDNKDSMYRIIIRGRLQEKWAQWLNGMIISLENQDAGGNETVITVRVPDQAALRGIMNKIWDLNLTLVSLIYCETNTV